MFRWAPFPLVRVAIVFCIGILVGIYCPDIVEFKVASIAALVILVLTVFFYTLRKRAAAWKYLLWFGCMMALSVSGFLIVHVRTDLNTTAHIIHLPDSVIAYEAVINDHFEEKANSFKTTVAIIRVRTGGGWMKASGKVSLYFSKTGYSHNLIWGDHILVNGQPHETTPTANPNEFNYRRFLTFKNIFHQHYVRQGEWTSTGEHDGSFSRYSAYARNYFSGIIKKYLPGKQEQAISLALIIGVKDGIDNELISAYSASGAMHVLAVSGLHVGIIYSLLLFLLKPFQKGERGKWFVSIICLSILWCYAFVTGLSPSVLRAVMMFSFVAVARAVNQKSSIYNTLAGSAFILLMIDPYLIMSVGFQLSYLAVIGIIWLQRPLCLLYEPTNGAIDWVWKISCVSIAAQATTFSLGLLYFHQFPTYFLFSNLIVIPTATVILVLGMVLIASSFISPVASVVGWLLEKFSRILNWSVFTAEDLPYSIVSDIYLDVPQAWLIMGMLTSLIFIFQYKKIQWLYAATLLSVLFSIDRWDHYSDRMHTPQLIVYNVSGSTAVEIIEKGRSVFLADSSLLHDKNKIRFHISGNRLYNLVSKTGSTAVKKSGDSIQLVLYNEKSLLFLNHTIKTIPESIKPDFVIVSREGVRSVPEILDRFPDATVILDATCNLYAASKLKSKLGKRGRVYSVAGSGAYVSEL